MNVKKTVRYILSFGLAAALLYVSFRDVEWERFISAALQCRILPLVAASLCTVAAFYVRAVRWRMLLRPFDATMDSLTSFNAINLGYIANFIFPRLGEVLKCGMVCRRSRKRHSSDPDNAIRFDEAVGTMLLARVIDIVMVFILTVLLLVLRWDRFGSFFIERIWAGSASGRTHSIIIAVIAVLVLAVAALAVFRLTKGRGVWRKKAGEFINGLVRGFKGFTAMNHKFRFIAYTLLMWAIYWLTSYAILRAMPQIDNMGLVDALFVTVAGTVGLFAPVPGGFGAYHGMVALGLATVYGIAWDDGLLCATLNHECQAVTVVVMAGISYLVETFRK